MEMRHVIKDMVRIFFFFFGTFKSPPAKANIRDIKMWWWWGQTVEKTLGTIFRLVPSYEAVQEHLTTT